MNPNLRVVDPQPGSASFARPPGTASFNKAEAVQLYEPNLEAASQAPMPNGTPFAGFVIERHLLRGPIGHAYIARESAQGPRYVLKVIHRDSSENHRFATRFQRDVHAIMLVTTPYIPEIRRSGVEDGHLFLAFEHIEGTSLAGRGTMDIEQVMRVARDCALGLSAIHQAGLVHRDLRPHTILQTKEGRVVLTEFGVLRTTMEDDVQLKATLPGFLSSEQAEDVLDIDIRSDLHALGTTMYLLLTGVMPFNAPTVERTKAMILADFRPSVRQIRNEVHPALDQIVARCMARHREMRYQTPEELIQALDACPHTKPMEGFTRGLITAQEWASDHFDLLKKAAVVLVLLIVLPIAWNAYSLYALRAELSALDSSSCTVEDADRLAPLIDQYITAVRGEPPEVDRWRAGVKAAHARDTAKKAAAAKAKEDEERQKAEVAKAAAAEEQRKRDEAARIEAARKAEVALALAAEKARLQAEEDRKQKTILDQRRLKILWARVKPLTVALEPLTGKPGRKNIIPLEDGLQRIADLDDIRTSVDKELALDALTNPDWVQLEALRQTLEKDLQQSMKRQESWVKSYNPTNPEIQAERKESEALRKRLAEQRLAENARWEIK